MDIIVPLFFLARCLRQTLDGHHQIDDKGHLAYTQRNANRGFLCHDYWDQVEREVRSQS